MESIQEQSNSNVTYRTRNQIIVNLTTGEYFISKSIKDRENKMRKLFKLLTKHDAILKQSIGTSRWEKTDTIKLIEQENVEPKFYQYVVENYSLVW